MGSELVVVIGPCGAGKTTYARASLPGHAHVDGEDLARTLFADPADFRYHPWVRAWTRRAMVHAVHDLVGHGRSTCVTADGPTVARRHRWVAIADEFAVPCRVVLVTTPAEVCVARARLDPRRPSMARSSWRGVVDNWFRDFEPVDVVAEGLSGYMEV